MRLVITITPFDHRAVSDARAFSVSGFRQERAGARRPNKAGANDPLPLFIAGSILFIREQVSSVCNQKKTSLKKT
jgi:hypothetical protein